MNFINHFIDLFIESAPWLILGFVTAGLIKTMIPEDFLTRHLGGQGLWTTIKAAIIGAPLPLCSCGVVPAAIGLRKSGASKNATVSFLIATPETGVDSVSVTYALMGPIMAIIRPIAAIVSAIAAGVLVGRSDSDQQTSPASDSDVETADSCCSSSSSNEPQTELTDSCCGSTSEPEEKVTSCCASSEPENQSESCCSSVSTSASLGEKLSAGMRFAFLDLIDDIAIWLLVGLLFAAAVLTWVPETFLVEWGNSWMAFLVMALIGVPMYICATASTPIAAGLLLAGISPGAVLVFMLTGPATNIGTMLIIKKELGQRSLIAYLAGVVITSFAFGYLLNQMMESFQWQAMTQELTDHAEQGHWLANISAVVLALMIGYSLYKEGLKEWRKRVVS